MTSFKNCSLNNREWEALIQPVDCMKPSLYYQDRAEKPMSGLVVHWHDSAAQQTPNPSKDQSSQ
jgi:hypothetical protein